MPKVYIRPLQTEDAQISYQWRNDPEIWKFTGRRPDRPITPQIEAEWLEKVLKDPSAKRFAIIVDDTYVGNIQLTNITDESAEYHIFIGERSFWGKGVAQLATALILRFANDVLKLNTVYLSVDPLNVAAIRVYSKCGFKENIEQSLMVANLKDLPVPVVSIFMLAYNHGKYISKAIQSILDQKTNFDFNIVIGEDCSNDNTRSIIADFAHRFPGKFKLLLHQDNVGAKENMFLTLKECQGQYIAMLEGDDYWSHSGKLQLQVDYLNAHPECSLCATAFERLKGDELFPDMPKQNHIGFNQMLIANTIGTASVLFPKRFITPQTFHYLAQFNIGDWPLWCWLLKKGDGVVLPEMTAVYRINESGVWSRHDYYSQVKFSIAVKLKLMNYWSVAKREKWLWNDYRVIFLRDEPSQIIRKDLYSLMPPSHNRLLLIVCTYLAMPLFRSVLRKLARKNSIQL